MRRNQIYTKTFKLCRDGLAIQPVALSKFLIMLLEVLHENIGCKQQIQICVYVGGNDSLT